MRFDMICEANDIEHRLTKPNHPWTKGQVEWMDRTIKEATVQRFLYESHDQLRTHLADFMPACNSARRLKTLSGLTPYEYIARIWTPELNRLIVDPIRQMPKPNTWVLAVVAPLPTVAHPAVPVLPFVPSEDGGVGAPAVTPPATSASSYRWPCFRTTMSGCRLSTRANIEDGAFVVEVTRMS